jgi:GNAT superfamily N-acetyltransferase
VTVAALSGRDGAGVAGAILGRAFLEDPVWGWMLRGSDRERRLVSAFTAFAGTASRTRGAALLVSEAHTAAALWLPPHAWRPSLLEQVRTAPGLARAVGAGGVLRGLRLQTRMTRHHPREPHWYLEALGAVPEARGTGVGASVVQPVLDHCDDQRLLAYLESSNPRNWSFYERLGFARGEPATVPSGCPVLMPMRRRPR